MQRTWTDTLEPELTICHIHEEATMPTTRLNFRKAGPFFAAVLVALMLSPAVSSAKNPKDTSAGRLGASHMTQYNPGGPTPGGSKVSAKPGRSATANVGCHDGASRTSYEGPCDFHPEHEEGGGCESDATRTSYPGNCRNSSEP